MKKNKELARTFQLAKCFLKTPEETINACHYLRKTYICHSIEQAYNNGLISYKKFNKAGKFIHKQLNDIDTIESWVLQNVPGVSYVWMHSNHGTAQMQAYRHRWLDHLIKELS